MNPGLIVNLRRSFREQAFKLDPAVEQMSTHFEMEVTLIQRRGLDTGTEKRKESEGASLIASFCERHTQLPAVSGPAFSSPLAAPALQSH